MFSFFRLRGKDEISLDIVAEIGNIVVKNGNNVEATFDTVERIVQLVASDNVAWTLLLVWTGLKVSDEPLLRYGPDTAVCREYERGNHAGRGRRGRVAW